MDLTDRLINELLNKSRIQTISKEEDVPVHIINPLAVELPNSEEVKRVLSHPLDANLYQELSKVLQKISSFKNTPLIERFYYRDLTPIGKREHIFRAKFQGVNVLIKTAIQGGETEYFIGRGLNRLRSEIPNFAYSFSAFKGGRPAIVDDRVVSWLDFPGESSYIVEEIIEPGESIADIAGILKAEEFLNYFLQVILSLRLAYQRFDFTHYDLAAHNVLIRDMDSELELNYQTPRGPISIKTSKIATIIDFGYSYALIDGVDYGTRYPSLGAESRPYPLSDCFRFLVTALSSLEGSPLFDQISPLLTFFTKEEPHWFVEIQSLGGYVLPYLENAPSLDQFIKFVLGFAEEHAPNLIKPSYALRHSSMLHSLRLSAPTQPFHYRKSPDLLRSLLDRVPPYTFDPRNGLESAMTKALQFGSELSRLEAEVRYIAIFSKGFYDSFAEGVKSRIDESNRALVELFKINRMEPISYKMSLIVDVMMPLIVDVLMPLINYISIKNMPTR